MSVERQSQPAPGDPSAPSASERLATPLQFLKGVGPDRARRLERLGLFTIRDLLFFFPRDYQDLTDLTSSADWVPGQVVRLRGTVREVDERLSRQGRHVLGALLDVQGVPLRALWFQMPYLSGKFRAGQELLLVGKLKQQGGIWQLVHPQVRTLCGDEPSDDASLQPLYPLTEGVQQVHVRRMMRAALDQFLDVLDEVFPDDFRAAHDLAPLRTALEAVHFPRNRASLDAARRRFIYQELFILQLALAIRRHEQQAQAQAIPLDATAKIDARICRLFPFELTPGQRAAIDEIAGDLRRTIPMHRLLQGDVGSGKTIVAVYAMLTAIAQGAQTALMAPTEILARQHADTLGTILSHSQVRWALLTGGTSAAERERILAELAAGTLHAVIGTQAIVQQDVTFQRLGLVVIDEQHKFGVRQRARLKRAAQAPHYLIMTATPIPRSLALTLFGDLDVTTLRDAPAGRQPIHTYWATTEQRESWWEFFRRKLREGRQGYVVAPRIDDEEPPLVAEEGDAPPLASVESLYEQLSHGPLAEFRVALLHGRQSHAEKEAIMRDFRSGRWQVLVATSVLEVGIDVANATLIVVESAQRFGLSQLHQLRGRVARGSHPGYCCLFADVASATGRERLEAFVQTTDGFQLAEVDFRLRGPGDLLGTKQHGLPPLRMADLLRDVAVLDEARRDAQGLVALDPGLARPEHGRLRRMVLQRYGQTLELGEVG